MSENSPKLWLKKFPKLTLESNKYTRGHAIIIGGDIEHTGAARMAATAALRIGAGLVTVAAPKTAIEVYAKLFTAIMVKSIGADFDEFIKDERKNAFLIGPGTGVNANTKKMVLKFLKLNKNLVIDADAITVFKNDPSKLFTAIKKSTGQTILTPHEGEFARIFSFTGTPGFRAQKAAKLSGATILLKGAKTIIATPDGKLSINNNAPPTLATAGSGDVLAGMITGLLAQDMPVFEAASAAAWIHGEAANSFGYGLIAEDLLYLIPKILQKLLP